jgi:hypothetical protein
MKAFKRNILALLAGIAVTTPVYAYIDPNAGGLIFQVLTPIISVVGAALALFGRHISRTFMSLLYAGRSLAGWIIRSFRRDLD